MKIRWLKEAAVALDAQHDFLYRRNPAAAKRVFDRIVEVAGRLRDFPNSGRPGEIAGTCELVVQGAKYNVVYRAESDGIEILRVFHTAKD